MNPEFNEYKPQYGNVQEMFKAKNKNATPWFISLLVIFVVMIFVQLAGIIHGFVLRESYIENINNLLEKKDALLADKAYRSLLITSSFYLVVLLVVTFWYIASFAKCIKNKDYSLFSSILLFIIPFIFFVILVNFIFNWNQILNLRSWNLIQITSLVNSLIFVFSYPFIFRQIKKVISEFYKLKAYYRSIQNGGLFNQLFSQFAQQNDNQSFSSNQKNNQATENNGNNVVLNEQTNQNSNTQDSKFNYYKNNLSTLEKENLVIMAKKLNIYNPEEFSKEQLIEKIALLFSDNNTNEVKESSSDNNSNETIETKVSNDKESILKDEKDIKNKDDKSNSNDNNLTKKG